MIQINNQEMKKAFSDSTKTQLMQQVAIVDNSKVIPIVDISPIKYKTSVSKRGEAINSTSGTIYTTPTIGDFYLTSAQLSYIKDATSTSLTTGVRITQGGVVVQILSLNQLTLTAGYDSVSLSFNPPLKVDRNTSITVNNSTNVANISACATISGYIEDSM